MNNDLISREALKKKLQDAYKEYDGYDPNDLMRFAERVDDEIDNAPTVEVPENAVNCVLTMFGKCSYNKTGCSDCEIKEKIRKALNERPQGKWERVGHIADRMCFKCSECGRQIYVTFGEEDKYPFCHCGADMRKTDNNATTVKSPCIDCIELECEYHGVVCPHYRAKGEDNER